MNKYEGNIKVVGFEGTCFPVDKDTLEPLSCSSYDSHPTYEPDALEIITYSEWCKRRKERGW